MSSAPANGNRDHYHHGNLRRALIDETLAAIEQTGSAEISLRMLAQRLGVSHAAPYAHFPDKQALLTEIAAEGLRRLATAIGTETAGGRADRPLTAHIRAYLAFATQQPGLYRLMFGGAVVQSSDTGFKAAERAAIAALERLAAIADPGTALGVDVSQRRASLIHGVLHGVALLTIARPGAEGADPGPDLDALSNDLAATLTDGIGAIARRGAATIARCG